MVMFKTISRFSSSFAALLTDQSTIIDVDGRLDDIRDAMLDSLLALDDRSRKDLCQKLERVTEVQTLWYLRSEMMALLASHYGEEVARQKLDVVTELFRGVVPDNQMPAMRRFKR